jgi:two-component system, OmpR family, KDP operon response regulator KdpE
MLSALIIDDEPEVLDTLGFGFQLHGFNVTKASSGNDGFSRLLEHRPDIIILDLGLQDMDGIQFLETLRKNDKETPVLVVSGRLKEGDELLSLKIGADDYIPKSKSIDVLMERVYLRMKQNPVQARPIIVKTGNLVLNLDTFTAFKKTAEIHLNKTQWDILKFLAKNPDKTIPNHIILETVWGFNHSFDFEYLRVNIFHIRDKIEDNPKEPKFITTFAKLGYRFNII